ncbi:ABC transporter permease [Acidimangrovimonas sediminis]|uniref:ABC transporter permease n=1 Tax=Acidimangrovimonas sediminis TaxID=2056283 RepID=UPI0018ED9412|nr:ABC transporter permease subunit [Acidimangrovimonas sediminis]
MSSETTNGGAPGRRQPAERRRISLSAALPLVFIGLFFLYVLAFLAGPAVSIFVQAFTSSDGGFTMHYVDQLFGRYYAKAYLTTAALSAATALIAVVAGLLTAYQIQRPGTPEWLRNAVNSFAGVAANFAGIPLAFAFISTLGTQGMLTLWLKTVGLDIYGAGFSLFSFWGLVLTYLYFQIPLMVIIITPALQGMRREWREAALNLGGNGWHYWWHVGIPVLTPAVLASFILLFGNAFASYATPYALTSGLVPLVPIEIGNLMSGNVIADPQLGNALSLGMIVVMGAAMILYTLLQKWAGRWQKR